MPTSCTWMKRRLRFISRPLNSRQESVALGICSSARYISAITNFTHSFTGPVVVMGVSAKTIRIKRGVLIGRRGDPFAKPRVPSRVASLCVSQNILDEQISVPVAVKQVNSNKRDMFQPCSTSRSAKIGSALGVITLAVFPRY